MSAGRAAKAASSAPGFSAELDDAARVWRRGGKQWIARYQAEEAARTGIASLKVGFNKVFGYYLEDHARAPRQGSGRLHPQADGQERRALHHAGAEGVRRKSAHGRREGRRSWSTSCFWSCATWWPPAPRRLRATAAVLAADRRAGGLAELARERGYCRPTMVDEPVLQIVDGRHPVLDAHAGRAARSFPTTRRPIGAERHRSC